MGLSSQAAFWFLPFVAPICVWVAWNDMAFMKIPNKAVLALGLVYLLIGPFALSLPQYGTGWIHLVLVLVVGFVLNMAGALGAGDAKFAAAAAPFIAIADLGILMMLLASVLLAAFVTHRLVRMTPLRAGVASWLSWTHAKFPMGLALGTTLLFYLCLAAAI